jgi:hypothetical protein
VRNHMEIVNEYENLWTYDINEIASVSVLGEYELDWLNRLWRRFLDYYVWNKDKLEGKVNIKARFNKFVESDFYHLLKRKIKWPWIDKITDNEFINLLNEWYFITSSCKFYLDNVRPNLDENWLERFRLMIQFFRNRDVWEKKWLTFNQRINMKGYNNPKIF